VFTDVRAEAEETVEHRAYNTKIPQTQGTTFRKIELTFDLPQKRSDQ
jgi:hypothetical protein